MLAEQGVEVVVLERRELDHAGAQWVNAVPAWMFDEAEVEAPVGKELLGKEGDFHLVAGSGPEKIIVERPALLEVDMRHLTRRMQSRARAAGVAFLPKTWARGFSQGGSLETSQGEFKARYFVDASGLAGARLLGQPRPRRNDICVAAQEVRRVTDQRGAESFFERFGAVRGDTVSLSGLAGGYSIVNASLTHTGEVSLLSGAIPGLGHPTGADLIEGFVNDNRWIGETLFGGQRAIPLGRPQAQLGLGGVALLGDAALQVFSAHGSGVGAGLVGARLLATIIRNEPACLHAYSQAWYRRWGSLFVFYDLFRRFVQNLSLEDVRFLFTSRMMNSVSVKEALHQHLDPGRLKIPPAWQLARRPSLVPRLAVLGRRLIRAWLAVRAYPDAPHQVAAWDVRLGRLLGEL